MHQQNQLHNQSGETKIIKLRSRQLAVRKNRIRLVTEIEEEGTEEKKSGERRWEGLSMKLNRKDSNLIRIRKSREEFSGSEIKVNNLQAIKDRSIRARRASLSMDNIGKIKKNKILHKITNLTPSVNCETQKQSKMEEKYEFKKEQNKQQRASSLKKDQQLEMQMEEVHYWLVQENQRLKRINFEIEKNDDAQE